MPVVYIGIGSNIEPKKNVPKALHLLASEVRVTAISTFYLTKALGSPGSGDFYNGVVRIETDIDPHKLKYDILREIEQTLGRNRSHDKYAPRTIDLDILLYNNSVIHDADIFVPDPDIIVRRFVYLPLIELDPNITMPDTEVKLADLVERDAVEDMTALHDFTGRLRKEIGIEPGKS